MFLGQNSWNVRARILDLSYDRLRQERVKKVKGTLTLGFDLTPNRLFCF